MGECVIPMKSRTEAERGRRMAISNKIGVTVVSVDPSMTLNGCTVGLRVPCEKAAVLARLFDSKDVRHGEIIRRMI